MNPLLDGGSRQSDSFIWFANLGDRLSEDTGVAGIYLQPWVLSMVQVGDNEWGVSRGKGQKQP